MREGAIDTLTIAHRLRDAGFDKRQAEAVTFAIHDGLTGNLATKEDIANLDGRITAEIANLDGKITTEIANLDGKITTEIANLDGKITALRGEVKEDIANLDGKIIALDGRITQLYWMFSILVAGVASLVIKAFFV